MHPSMASDAEANFYILPKDHTQHKEKKEHDSSQEVLNKVGRKHILCPDSYGGTCVDLNSSAERLANPNSPFFHRNRKFLSGLN